MIDAFEAGNYEKAKYLHYKMLQLSNAMFIETNPIPVKTSLALMGKIGGELRLPLVPLSSTNLEKLKEVLKNYGLI